MTMASAVATRSSEGARLHLLGSGAIAISEELGKKTSWASRSMPVPESIGESNDMFKGICAVFVAMFVVATSWEREARNSATTVACMVGVALAAAAAGAATGSLAADEFGKV